MSSPCPPVPSGGALTLALLAFLGCGSEAPPRGETGPGDGPASRVQRPDFDASRAYRDLVTQVDFGPRIPGTEGHARQLRWMLDSLRIRADTVVADTFTHVTRQGETRRLTNVMARWRPDSEHRVLVLAHWDTRPRADQADDPADRERPVPGANDGASGVAVLLELSRMLARQPPPTGVDLLFVDGEDYGPGTEDMFLGARRYAETVDPQDRPAYGILLDMVADQQPRFPVEGYSAELAPEVVQRVWGLARELGYGRWFPGDVTQRINDDHVPLNRAGIPTVDIIDFEYGDGNALWHTPHDTPANTGPTGLRVVGEVVAELLYRGG